MRVEYELLEIESNRPTVLLTIPSDLYTFIRYFLIIVHAGNQITTNVAVKIYFVLHFLDTGSIFIIFSYKFPNLFKLYYTT